ncbi:MAG: hypothetical protein V3R84_03275 [Acidimicrobiia bacterium]
MATAAYWDELVASTVKGRRWVAALDVLGGLDRLAERMIRHGAEGLFVIAGSRGTGDPPPPGFASWKVLGISADTIMNGIRNFERALVDLPADVVAAVDAFDPDRSARVLRTVVAVDHAVAGRECYGTRPAAWAELEDKLSADQIWDRAGVVRAPSAIAAASSHDLKKAARDHDRGMGTVWAGDNREGWHGGASYTRWVRDEESAAQATAFFEDHCDRVRVMPFLDGVPCSIHGIIVGDEVITFRPVELIILRRPDSAELFYAGAATTWDPPDADRQTMRRAAVGVGEHLRDSVGYRGAYNLDGVLTSEGWRPTELNARFSVGLGTLQQHFEAPLYHLHLNIVEGEDLDYRARELERQVTEVADEKRSGGFGAPLDGQVTEERSAGVVFEDDTCRFAHDDGENADGTLTLGPGPQGSYLRLRLRNPQPGKLSSEKAVQAIALADAEWGTGIGALAAAPDVR